MSLTRAPAPSAVLVLTANGSPQHAARDWQNENPAYNSPGQVGIKLHGCGLQDETIKIALKYTRGLTILDCVRSVTTDSGHGPASRKVSPIHDTLLVHLAVVILRRSLEPAVPIL